MNSRKLLMASALAFALVPAARAELLAAGSLYGGSSQNLAVCYLFNAGASTVTIPTNQIIRDDGVAQTLIIDTCGSLAPGRTCGIAANIVGTLSHSCKMVVVPSAADVRGAFEVRQGLTVLNNLPLR